MRVNLIGSVTEARQVLTWDKIVPDIPELSDKLITSVKLDIVAGEVARAKIKYRSPDDISQEKELSLCLTDLNLDFGSMVENRAINFLGKE